MLSVLAELVVDFFISPLAEGFTWLAKPLRLPGYWLCKRLPLYRGLEPTEWIVWLAAGLFWTLAGLGVVLGLLALLASLS